MPPKPKFTREEIILAAYDMAAARGIDAVMAREVGKAMGSTARPIFTVFSGMDELKEEVRALAMRRCLEDLSGAFDYEPAFKEFGMRWVRFALEQPHLYSLLFSRVAGPDAVKASFGKLTARIIDSAMREFGLSPVRAEALLDRMIVYSNGIAAFALNGDAKFSQALLARSLSEVCIALVIRFQMLDDQFNPAAMRQMLMDPDRIPNRVSAAP